MAAKKARDLSERDKQFFREVFTNGFQAAQEKFGFTADQAQEILTDAGFEADQIDILSKVPGLEASAIIAPGDLPPALKDLQQQASQLGDRSFDVFTRGGVSDQTAFQRDRLTELQAGTTLPQQQLTDIGGELFRTRGRTAQLDEISDVGRRLAQSGGRAGAPGLEEAEKNALAALGREDPGLAKIREAGLALADAGGFTPELKGLLGQASSLLAVAGSGGMTPQLQQVFDQAINIVQAGGRGGALLPFDQVLQNAREEAAFAINSQVQRAVREARSRGGTQAGLVAGAAASPLAEFADQAAEAQARAVRDASAKQQALQLQQLGVGFQAAGGAAAAGAERESRLVGAGAGLAGDVAGAASRNLATGLGEARAAQTAEVQRQGVTRGQLIDIGQVFAGREATGLQAATNAEQLVQSRLGLGANIQQSLNQSQLQASNLLNNLSSIEAGREATGLQGALGANQAQANIFRFGTDIDQQNFANALSTLTFEEGLRQQDIENIFDSLNFTQRQGEAQLGFAGNALRLSESAGARQAGFQAQPGVFTGTILPGIINAAIGGGVSAATTGLTNVFGGGGTGT
jgi:hypothetical protein